MAEQNAPMVTINSFNKGMVKDMNDTFVGEGLWLHARNAINNAHLGEIGVLGNEQSNTYCAAAPYTIIGAFNIKPGEWLLFSTNDLDSEIGVFNENECTYTKTVNDRCLGFKTTNLISGAVKQNYDCTYSAYWQDNLSPDRYMNINNVPYKYILQPDTNNPDCKIKVYTNELDCDRLLLHPHLIVPCYDLIKGNGSGQLPNGSYQITIAYLVNGVRVTDYFTPSNVQSLFSHENVSGSLEINISQIDETFDEFELVAIGFINQSATARKVGVYNTTQKTIFLDNYSQSLEVVPLSLIPLQTPLYDKSERMFEHNGYLMRSGVSTKPDFNYQPLANKITTKWISVEYPADYYVKGGNKTSYMRDEQYSFFIRWIYNTGFKSASYHIPGRAPLPTDITPVLSNDPDVIEPTTETQLWQVKNTAAITNLSVYNLSDGGRVIAEGDMGYWESTERYPSDKANIWGDLCGKAIRHHKFPDTFTDGQDVTHIHSDGGEFVRIMGVKFENIEHPLDIDGTPITSIVGYEILRGNREGNRTIIAKGLINNLREYDIPNQGGRKGLYQNYPFNDLGSDKYHRKFNNNTDFNDSGSGFDDIDSDSLTDIRRDMFSFHAPETNFRNPYLNAKELKIYNLEYGVSTGQFQTVYKHPKSRVLRDSAAITAATVAGLLIANALIAKVPITIGGTDDIPMTLPVTAGVDAIDIGTTTNAVSVAAQIASGAAFLLTGWDMINQNVLDTFVKFTKPKDYALQYNSHGDYNKMVDNAVGNKRRKINRGNYIDPSLLEFGNTHRINNLYRNRFVALELDTNVADPTIADDSRKLISEISQNVGEDFNQTVSSYYAAVKVDYQNQYGQLGNIAQVPVSTCIHNTLPIKRYKHSSSVLFGGDVYINRYTEKNSMFFFNTNACGLPDDVIYDYRFYVNIPYPRYWMDTNKYEGLFSGQSGGLISTPSDQRFLNDKNAGGIFSLTGAYFYLFNSGVRDFFCESEINLAHRDWGNMVSERHYDRHTYTDLNQLFRSDIIATGNYYKYDYSLSLTKTLHQYGSWGYVLPNSYNPSVSQTCFAKRPKRVLYSLQQQSEGKKDNWRSYLVNNYKDFDSEVTSIKSINRTGAIILYKNAEPTQFSGVDQLQTETGLKITIGDGGLFQQTGQTVVNADNEMQYGACQDSRSVINTPYGLFYVSQRSGKIMTFSGGGLDEISRQGMKHWFMQYLPSKLLQQFPDYEYADNPVTGIGCTAVYDPTYELLYFSKKDYIPKNGVLYEPGYGFYIDNSQNGYTCNPGFTYNAVSGLCEKTTYAVPNPSMQCYNIDPSTNNAYGLRKAAIYDLGWNADGTGIGFDHTNVLNPANFQTGLTPLTAAFWSTVINGVIPLPGSGIWTEAGQNITGQWLGFTKTICLAQTKTYYVAVAADNWGRLTLDGVVIWAPDTQNKIQLMEVNHTSGYNPAADPTASNANVLYRRIHIYPVVMTAGSHVLKLEGYNVDGPGMLSAIIFDNTYAQIATATTYSQLNVVFSTQEALINNEQMCNVTAVCPPGYTATADGECNITCSLFQTEPPITRPLRIKVQLEDPLYFDKCSWTVSYDPKQKVWLSFHDWHPTLMLQSHYHFLTINRNTIWKHNITSQSYCNYYGTNYNFEIELVSSTGQAVTTTRNGEYILECYTYSPDGRDYYEVLDFNFDQAIVYNNEQISGVLNLVLKPKNDPYKILTYPIINPNDIDILYSKEENKYRFNQFYDITKDRGEFSTAKNQMWLTECNGYIRKINSNNVDYNKPPTEHKKFRHYVDRMILVRKVSGNVKMLLKLFNTKHLNSPR
jgi:hypothetical protein